MTEPQNLHTRYSVQVLNDGEWVYINHDGQLVGENYSEWDELEESAQLDAKMFHLAHGHTTRVVARKVSDIWEVSND